MKRHLALAIACLFLTRTVTYGDVVGSGGVPKGGGSGAGVTFPMNIPGGSGAAPSLRFSADQSGFWQRAATVFDASIAGIGTHEFSNGGANVATGLMLGNALALGWVSGTTPAGAGDTIMVRDAAATIQMGIDVNGAPVSQSIKGPDGITGTDLKGGNMTVAPGKGTGAGAAAAYNVNRNLMLGTGTTAQSQANAETICESKTLSNTSATTTALATVALASNAAGAVQVTISVQCNDGTNFDSDLLTSYVAYVNKAGAITFGTPVTTASAASNNSGSCTVAPTFTAGASLINVNVTPVITTITPTTTTAFLEVHNFGAGAVACQ